MPMSPKSPNLPKPIGSSNKNRGNRFVARRGHADVQEVTTAIFEVLKDRDNRADKILKLIVNALPENFEYKNTKYISSVEKLNAFIKIHPTNTQRNTALNLFLAGKLRSYEIVWNTSEIRNNIAKAAVEFRNSNRGSTNSNDENESTLTQLFKVESNSLKGAIAFLQELGLNLPGIKIATSIFKLGKGTFLATYNAYKTYKLQDNELLSAFSSPVFNSIHFSIYKRQLAKTKEAAAIAGKEVLNFASNFIPGGQIISTGLAVVPAVKASATIYILIDHWKTVNELNNKLRDKVIGLDEIQMNPVFADFLLSIQNLNYEEFLGISDNTKEVQEFYGLIGDYLLSLKQSIKIDPKNLTELPKNIWDKYCERLKISSKELINLYPYKLQQTNRRSIVRTSDNSKGSKSSNSIYLQYPDKIKNG